MQLTEEERDFLYAVANQIMGRSYEHCQRPEVIISNVRARMRILGSDSLEEYLNITLENEEEFAKFVSSLTIHTTSWFREVPHFAWFKAKLHDLLQSNPKLKIRILSAACASGEEAYSIAFICENFRLLFPDFDYEVVGLDIDPVSINQARLGRYPKTGFLHIEADFQSEAHSGVFASDDDHFQVKEEIQERCHFRVANLKRELPVELGSFDSILCRNVLIYFSDHDVSQVIANLCKSLNPGGILIVGHSEAIEAGRFGLKSERGTIYSRPAMGTAAQLALKKRQVLVQVDLTTLRRHICQALKLEDTELHCFESMLDCLEAADRMAADLLLVDSNGQEDGLIRILRNFRHRHRGCKIAVVVDRNRISAKQLTELESLAHLLIERQECFTRARHIREWFSFGMTRRGWLRKEAQFHKLENKPIDAILVGASTGGPNALVELLADVPSHYPPIVVIQHISGQFHTQFAQRMASISGLKNETPRSGSPLRSGSIYIAHGDYHLGIAKVQDQLILRVLNDKPINGHRPSVDQLFLSAARISEARFMAILLTGMGSDGAVGLKELYKNKSYTFCQTAASCVVASMPTEALKLCPSHRQASPKDLRVRIDELLQRPESLKTVS